MAYIGIYVTTTIFFEFYINVICLLYNRENLLKTYSDELENSIHQNGFRVPIHLMNHLKTAPYHDSHIFLSFAKFLS